FDNRSIQFMKHKYAMFVIWSPEDKAYLASPAELPGCVADGETQEEAVRNLEVVIGEWIEVAKEEGRKIPEPMTTEDFEKAQQEFQNSLQNHIRNEVNSAVQRVIEQLASSQQERIVH